MSVQINLNEYPVAGVLELLLTDKTTKENILFATDSYADFGPGYSEKSQMTAEKLRAIDRGQIQPRVLKSLEAQKQRTRMKAEVMTPGWVVCKMNAYADEEWFGRPDVFETRQGEGWTPTEGPVRFPKGKNWRQYVDTRRIEITCGEAPYIVSRYDVTTGELIPPERRMGLLDRKLRIVNENTGTEEEWLKWSRRAFQSVYGYELQGDSLLIARINLICTYAEYMQARLGRRPTQAELKKTANVIVWNFWQMDGLTGTIPYARPEGEQMEQFTLEGFFDEVPEEPQNVQPVCLVRDWRESGVGGKAHKFTELKRRA